MGKELNKKLAGWAGFRPATQQEYSPGSIPDPSMDRRGWGYLYPDGGIKWYLPDFTQSLDACFKWLFQPLCEHLIKKSSDYSSFQQLMIDFLIAWVKDFVTNDFYHDKVEPKGEALALCLAIEKLIDECIKTEAIK